MCCIISLISSPYALLNQPFQTSVLNFNGILKMCAKLRAIVHGNFLKNLLIWAGLTLVLWVFFHHVVCGFCQLLHQIIECVDKNWALWLNFFFPGTIVMTPLCKLFIDCTCPPVSHGQTLEPWHRVYTLMNRYIFILYCIMYIGLSWKTAFSAKKNLFIMIILYKGVGWN